MTTRSRELDLLHGLWRLTDASRLHLDAMMQDLMELSLPQLLLLQTIGDPKTQHTPTSAARRLGCSGATVTKLVAALERKGCLTKFRHADDARRTWLVVTIGGGDDLERAEAQLAADADDFFAPLDDAEKDQLRGLLAKIRVPR